MTVVDDDYDKPSRIEAWLRDAGLAGRVAWQHRELVMIVAEHCSAPDRV